MISRYLFRALYVDEEITNGIKGHREQNRHYALYDDELRRIVSSHVRNNNVNNKMDMPPIISLTDRLDVACRLAYENKLNVKESNVVAIPLQSIMNANNENQFSNLVDLSTYNLFLNYTGETVSDASSFKYPRRYGYQTFKNFNREAFSADNSEYCHIGPIASENIVSLPKTFAKGLLEYMKLKEHESELIYREAKKLSEIDFELWKEVNFIVCEDFHTTKAMMQRRNKETYEHYIRSCEQLLLNYAQGNYIDLEDLLYKDGVSISDLILSEYPKVKRNLYGLTEQQVRFLADAIDTLENSDMMKRRQKVYDTISKYVENPDSIASARQK